MNEDRTHEGRTQQEQAPMEQSPEEQSPEEQSRKEQSPEEQSRQEQSPEDQSRQDQSRQESTSGETKARKFHVGRVLLAIVPLTALALLGFAFLALDGSSWLGRLFRPGLVPAKGSIFYRGEPLVDATVMTYPAGGGYSGALAVTDEYGNFELQTDINGTYQPGASPGEYKLTVAVYVPSSGAGPPSLDTPEQFADQRETPLVIEISGKGPNEFRIRLDDYLEESQGTPPGSRAAALLATLLNAYDEDQSGSLSFEEIEAVEQRFREPMKRADVNADGQLDRQELTGLLENQQREGDVESVLRASRESSQEAAGDE